MENDELLTLMQEFIKESKSNTLAYQKDHKEINKCLTAVKLQVSKVESLCESSVLTRQNCFLVQNDVENRLRVVEKVIPGVQSLPDDFKDLVKKVYATAGAMTLVLIVAGYLLKGH